MSRHRQFKRDIEEDEDYEDFDPMEDTDSPDYYIARVIEKTGPAHKDQVLKALQANDWNVQAAIKVINAAKQKTQKPAQKASPQKASPQKNAAPAPKQPEIKVAQPQIKIAEPSKKLEEDLPKLDAKSSSTEEVKTPHIEESKTPILSPQVSKQDLNADYPDIYPDIVHDGKPTVNLVVIGHVDAGKSTLMGHLLFLLGYIDPKVMHAYERDCKAIGKDSFQYAWVLDGTTEERQRGVTIDVACKEFSTENREVVLLDAPGHKDFVPNMISGAAQADAAILVIDSCQGAFESGFEGENHHGQTKEHSFLARSLGVSNLIVGVNKLDMMNWDQGRFLEIQNRLNPFLRTVGFRDNSVTYIPISGLGGVNLTSKPEIPELASWYNGPCLIELIDSLPPSQKDAKKPARLCIMDSYKLSHGTLLGQIVSGKIESGTISINDKIVIIPTGIKGRVKAIEKAGHSATKAYAGENVDVVLKDAEGDFGLVLPGHVLCSELYPVPQVKNFKIKAVTFDILFPVTREQNLIMHIQSLKIPVKVKRILQQIDPINGKVIKERPRCLTKFMSAILEIESSRRVCLEKFSNCKGLGRVTLRDHSETVMAGMVIELLE
ncbi:HBS1L [Blepharisma stoltei]|uniref:Tr-type G domain-containing protein n=1 Tax=Blepharisma stoltei TaxID=1481888 RepID=A0AAU9JTE1_9CILI|nr:unnamed protein product [Blepharisma stoltei]